MTTDDRQQNNPPQSTSDNQSDGPGDEAQKASSPAPASAIARRSRNTTIVIGALVLVVALLLVWFASQYLLPVINGAPDRLQPLTELSDDEAKEPGKVPIQVHYETSDIPDLIQLFGKTTEQALAYLGPGWVVTKSTDADQVGPEADEPESPVLLRVITLTYTANVTSVEGGSLDETDSRYAETVALIPQANIYLSLNSEGRVFEVYYTGDLDLLGIDQQEFFTMLSNDSFLRLMLYKAGIDSRDFTYASPDYNSSTTYDNPGSANPKVTKQSAIYSGRVAGDGAPTAWVITVTYEFIPSVSSPSGSDATRRTVHISLS
ncbi:MAG: hypothetical protein FWH40_04165 [Coriobacteriia bacterium]|nr:hypothetical protein [Coriobacteriia bacterium]